MKHSLETLKTMFSEYLGRERFNRTPQALYTPNNYILSLGGKRLRPVLALMGCEWAGSEPQRALPVALAIEYFHNYTLIHDDIMDQAELRRGHASVHTKFGTNEAILSGDVLMIYAYHYLTQYDAALSHILVKLMNKTAIEVCEGQSMDMSFETRPSVDESEYLEMIRLKTSVLLAAALKMGALVGGASEKDAGQLYEYGLNLGLGFQMQDDLLDSYGDEKVGKRIGGDILQGKQTLLLIHALSEAEKAGDGTLAQLLQRDGLEESDKIARVLALYETYGSKAYVQKRRDAYVDKALSALQEVNRDRKPLETLVELLVKRQY